MQTCDLTSRATHWRAHFGDLCEGVAISTKLAEAAHLRGDLSGKYLHNNRKTSCAQSNQYNRQWYINFQLGLVCGTFLARAWPGLLSS